MKKIEKLKDNKTIKKMSKRRKRKIVLNRLIIIFVFLGLLTLLSLGIIFSLNTLFAVKEIYAKSNLKYDSQSIIYSSGIKIGDNLCFLSSKESEKRICQFLPYIETAKVKKSFPNKVSIEVELAKPNLVLVSEDKYFLISERNKFLENCSDSISELVSIIGLKFSVSDDGNVIYEEPHLKEKIDLINSSFKEKELILIKSIDVSDPDNIVVNYDNRISIYFGSEEDTEYKILTASEIIQNKLASSEKGILDVKTVKKNNRSYFTSE